jgi:hypothetical protein
MIEYRALELEIDLKFVDDDEEKDGLIEKEPTENVSDESTNKSCVALTNTSCLGLMFLRFKVS